MLFIKKTDENKFRINLVNEFGVKYFDFEFDNDVFTVKYCIESLNKSIIINTLKKDFILLLAIKPQKSVLQVYTDTLSQKKVYQLKNKNEYSYYFFNTLNPKEVVFERYKRNKKITSVSFFTNTSEIPDSLSISHYNLTLNMNFSLLKFTQLQDGK